MRRDKAEGFPAEISPRDFAMRAAIGLDPAAYATIVVRFTVGRGDEGARARAIAHSELAESSSACVRVGGTKRLLLRVTPPARVEAVGSLLTFAAPVVFVSLAVVEPVVVDPGVNVAAGDE